MAATISPAAEVDPAARLGDGVTVASGAVIEADCIIGSGSAIGRNSIIWRGTVIGSGNRIFPFCSLGGEPQDKKYTGEEAPLIIGDNNTIREYSFINKGTAANGETRLGNDNWIMGYVHAAHDCIIGSGNIIANAVQLAGHVIIGDRVVLGGGVLVHQFRRIGSGAMLGGGEHLRCDVPPFALAGEGVVSVNREGMRRHNYSPEAIQAIQRAYKILYRDGLPLAEAAAEIAALPEAAEPPLAELHAFLQQPGLNLLRPRGRAGSD